MGEAKRRREHCAYCGASKTSDDHVPPKNLFSADRTNLITVPACDLHNNRRSQLDERFREFVSMSVGVETPTTLALWESMAKGIRRSKKRQAEVRQNSTWLPQIGMYKIRIEIEAFHPMIEWITRGLYWHCYKQRLPLEVQVDTHLVRLGDWLPDLISDMARAVVGIDQFFYAYTRMNEHPTVSVWVFLFHRRLATMAFTDKQLIDRKMSELGFDERDL